jgi:hypothetical protein
MYVTRISILNHLAINSSGLAQPKGERNGELGYGEKWLRQRVNYFYYCPAVAAAAAAIGS